LLALIAGGVCIQSIEHPGCVWDVNFLPNGDLVTACSDGVARVWTREKQRYAPVEEMEGLQSLISTRKSATFVSIPYLFCYNSFEQNRLIFEFSFLSSLLMSKVFVVYMPIFVLDNL
jgi:WD40 repeat protein